MVLAGGYVADVRVAGHRTTLRLHQHIEHGLDVGGILWQQGRRTRRDIVESIHIRRQFPAQFVDPRHKSFKMISVFNPSVLDRKSTRLNSSHGSISYAV